MIPIWDLRVTLSPAWLASTKQETITDLPLGSGAFGGIGSFALKMLNNISVRPSIYSEWICT
jgi:hypothetical protein